MHFLTSSILTILSFLHLVITSPSPTRPYQPRHHSASTTRSGCLTTDEAVSIRNSYVNLFIYANFTEDYALQYVTSDYQLYSDSSNELFSGGTVSSGVTFDSAAALAAGSSGNDPTLSPTFDDIIVACDAFSFRYSFSASPIAVRGIDMVYVQQGSYLVQSGNQEFNSLGFCMDLPGCISGVAPLSA